MHGEVNKVYPRRNMHGRGMTVESRDPAIKGPPRIKSESIPRPGYGSTAGTGFHGSRGLTLFHLSLGVAGPRC